MRFLKVIGNRVDLGLSLLSRITRSWGHALFLEQHDPAIRLVEVLFFGLFGGVHYILQ